MNHDELPQKTEVTHATHFNNLDERIAVTPGKPGNLLRLPAVEIRTGLRKSTIYAGVAAKTFPEPVRASRRSVAWIENEIDNWVLERVAARDDAHRPAGKTPEH